MNIYVLEFQSKPVLYFYKHESLHFPVKYLAFLHLTIVEYSAGLGMQTSQYGYHRIENNKIRHELYTPSPIQREAWYTLF